MSRKVKRGRGRPAVYTGNAKRSIVGLVRQHNAVKARDILNAPAGSDLAAKRNLNLFPNPVGISLPTLGKFAAAAGVAHKRGRPSVKKAA